MRGLRVGLHVRGLRVGLHVRGLRVRLHVRGLRVRLHVRAGARAEPRESGWLWRAGGVQVSVP